MKTSRVALLLWVVLIAVLLLVEFAEITRLFTIPVQNAIADPLAFVIALIFTTLIALVGAIFIGVFLSHRILNPTGFTPFEEEMLRMRSDIQEIRKDLDAIRVDQRDGPSRPPSTGAGEESR
jgi:uncharacterized membrane protein (DUF106 family)